jgi:hypothetical protein
MLLDLTDEESANTAQHAVMIAELIAFNGYHVAARRLCTLRHHNDHETSAGTKAIVNFPHYALDTVRDLRNQDDVGPSSNGCCQGNPAGVPTLNNWLADLLCARRRFSDVAAYIPTSYEN